MKYRVPFYRATYPNRLNDINVKSFNDIALDANSSLEERCKSILDLEYILSVNNISSAMHLALSALDLKRGDKVICPINSYVDTPEAIREFDSEPIFTDIELRSYHMSIESLRGVLKSAKSKKLRAVVVSHFAGLAFDISEVVKLAKEYKIVVIEDFTDYSVIDKNIEIKGDIAIFSLNYKFDNSLKGAVVGFRDSSVYDRAKLLREHGLVKKSREVDYLYDVVDMGYDYRLDSLSAYLLDGLIDRREELQKERVKVANIYFEKLNGLNHITLPVREKFHKYSYFIIEVDKNRDAFARELKLKGVEVGLHYIPLNFTTYYKNKYELKVFSFPNALSVYQTTLSIPCNGKMSSDDIEYVCSAIKEVDRVHI